MKTYSNPVIKLHCFITTDVLTSSNGLVDSFSTHDTDVTWGGNW